MPTEVPEHQTSSHEAALGRSVLEVDHLTVSFDHTVILADLNFTVARGVFALVAAVAVIAFILKTRDRLLVSLVSTEVAIASGIGVKSLQLSFLVAFAVTVALGMRYLGVLLMGSLIIIPATVAKRLARSIDGMFAIATGAALVSTLLGSWIAALTQHPSGPVIVAIAGGLFFVSLLKS